MQVDYDKLKNIENETKYLVFGFLRISSDLLDLNMPDLIIFTCLSFYYISEYFAKPGTNIEISCDGAKITKICSGHWENVTYGNKEITSRSKGIYKWYLKMIKCRWHIVVGISASTASDASFWSGDKYGYWSTGNKISKNGNCDYGACVRDNDIVCMELDMQSSQGQNTLTFYVDDESQGVAFDGIDFDCNQKYRLAVSIYHPTACVELIEFTVMNHS
eukprot:192546_1